MASDEGQVFLPHFTEKLSEALGDPHLPPC